MRRPIIGLTIAGVIGSIAALGWVLAIWTSHRVTVTELPHAHAPDRELSNNVYTFEPLQ